MVGLGVALGGLVLVVLDSLLRARVSFSGVGWALAALACITLGTSAQKRIALAPTRVLPLQCAVALLGLGLVVAGLLLVFKARPAG